ncbi:MAG: protein-glutamate O-methyltransferase CheR [Nitrospiraceae bacterium]|nr:MAG: protein-glutamate O-methyltransferase CheR [Nitrospiraceae bacterium]
MADGYKLPDDEFNSLREYIYKKSGILFTGRNRFQLEMKIRERLDKTGCGNIPCYIKYLGSPGSVELNTLFNTITVNETSFFRDRSFIATIEKNVIPEIIKTNRALGFGQVRIWSAAASSGEEAYTIAIMLAEQLKGELSKWSVRIFATDINDDVLKACRTGIYSSYSMRNAAPDIRQRYFRQLDSDRYEIRDDIKAMVIPGKCNLMDTEGSKKFNKLDLLLIRNVLIYFDAESKKKVLKTCYENLKPGGHMFLGHSETLFGFDNDFKLVHFVNAVGYRK